MHERGQGDRKARSVAAQAEGGESKSKAHFTLWDFLLDEKKKKKKAVHNGDGHCVLPPEMWKAKVIGVLCLAARSLERISR